MDGKHYSDISAEIDGDIADHASDPDAHHPRVRPWLSGTSFPANPQDGDFFYRTDQNKIYRYSSTLGIWLPLDYIQHTDRIADGIITPPKTNFGVRGDRPDIHIDEIYETTSTSYECVVTIELEGIEDVKNVLQYVSAYFRSKPSTGSGEPPGPPTFWRG